MPLGIEDQYKYMNKTLVPSILTKYVTCYTSIKNLLAQIIAKAKTITADAVSEVTGQMGDLLSNYGLQCAGVQLFGKGDILATTADKMDLIKKLSAGSIYDSAIHRLETVLLGNLYVVNEGNGTIVRYTSEGDFISIFGGSGSGDGQFNSPNGIRYYRSANALIIVDTGNNRVQILTAAGAFITKYGSPGSGDRQFNNPYGIALGGSEIFCFVTDTGNNRVQMMYTASGTYAGKWGTAGTGAGEFNNPRGIALDSLDYVYVVDTGNNRIQKFRIVLNPSIPSEYTGLFISEWYVYDTPVGIDISGDYVYITCASSNLVKVFKTDGTYIHEYSSDFNGPKSIIVGATSPPYFYIADNSKVFQLRGDEFLRTINSGYLQTPSGVALGPGFDSCQSLTSALNSIKIEVDSLDLSELQSVFAALDSLLQSAASALATLATVLGCGQEMLGEVSKIFPAAGALNVSVTTAINNVKKAQDAVAKDSSETKYVPNIAPYTVQLAVGNISIDKIRVFIDGTEIANDTNTHPTNPSPNKFSIDYVRGLVYFNTAQKSRSARMNYTYSDLNEVFGASKNSTIKDLGLGVDLNAQKIKLNALNAFFK